MSLRCRLGQWGKHLEPLAPGGYLPAPQFPADLLAVTTNPRATQPIQQPNRYIPNP